MKYLAVSSLIRFISIFSSIASGYVSYSISPQIFANLDPVLNLFISVIVMLIVFLFGAYIEILMGIKSITNANRNILIRIDDNELKAQKVNDYFRLFKYSQYHEQVADIIKKLLAAVDTEICQKEETTILKVYRKSLIKELEKCSCSIEEITSGRIPVYEDRVRYFWRDEIMTNVKHNIWTTNVSIFEGSFGRNADPDLIEAQANAITQNNVKFIRVFVFDPYGNEDLEQLRKLMRIQIKIGISVWAIEEKTFNNIPGRYIEAIGCADFMILDESVIYLTHSENGIVKRTELIRHPAKLKTAIEISKSIMGASWEINFENIDTLIIKAE